MTLPVRTSLLSASVTTGAATNTKTGVAIPNNQWLQVTVIGHGGTAPTGVTFNGSAMTLGGQTTPDGGATHGGNHSVSFWWVRNTSGSTVTASVVATFSNNQKIEIHGATYSGLNTTTPFAGFSAQANTNNGGASPSLTLTTLVDDLVIHAIGMSYGASGSMLPDGGTPISESDTASEYGGVAEKAAAGTATSVSWARTYAYGFAFAGIVAKTATPVVVTLSSVDVTAVGASTMTVGASASFKVKALASNGTGFAGATLTPTGINTALATFTPASATADANGEAIFTLTGVSPGAVSFGASAFDGVSTTVNDPSPLAVTVAAGIGGVSVVGASAPTYTPTVDVGQSALRMSVGETKAIQCKFKSPLSGAAIIGYMPTAAATVPGSATVAVSGVTDSYGIATVSITALKVGDIVVNVT